MDWVLRHPVRQAPVDVLRMLALDHHVQTRGQILNLAALTEEPVLHQLVEIPACFLLGAHVPDAAGTLDAHAAVLDEPGAVCPLGAHSATAIPQHAVQAEEVRVVRVQVILLVFLLREEGGALGEGHPGVDLRLPLEEEEGQRLVKEVRLVLVARVGDAEQRRLDLHRDFARGLVQDGVPLLDLQVVVEEVVLHKVEAPRFAAACADGYNVPVGVEVSVLVLSGAPAPVEPALLAPLLVVHGHLVVPAAAGDVLRLECPLVLVRLRARDVVQDVQRIGHLVIRRRFRHPGTGLTVIQVHWLRVLVAGVEGLLSHN
mmetsp:Transcript_86219/g.244172  ORF Transcript_86219/g.244172 Transcript_86219/m.244172 type:complete len:315 (+) Transcript_86219:1577-2521(+)